MAKIRFYSDIWPGQWPAHGLTAFTTPLHQKMDNAKRLAFDVVIPDNVLTDTDVFSPEPAFAAVVDEATHDG